MTKRKPRNIDNVEKGLFYNMSEVVELLDVGYYIADKAIKSFYCSLSYRLHDTKIDDESRIDFLKDLGFDVDIKENAYYISKDGKKIGKIGPSRILASNLAIEYLYKIIHNKEIDLSEYYNAIDKAIIDKNNVKMRG